MKREGLSLPKEAEGSCRSSATALEVSILQLWSDCLSFDRRNNWRVWVFCGHREVENGEGSPLMALHVTGAALTAAWVAEKSRAASLKVHKYCRWNKVKRIDFNTKLGAKPQWGKSSKYLVLLLVKTVVHFDYKKYKLLQLLTQLVMQFLTQLQLRRIQTGSYYRFLTQPNSL